MGNTYLGHPPRAAEVRQPAAFAHPPVTDDPAGFTSLGVFLRSFGTAPVSVFVSMASVFFREFNLDFSHVPVPAKVRSAEGFRSFKEKCQYCMVKQSLDLGNAIRTFSELVLAHAPVPVRVEQPPREIHVLVFPSPVAELGKTHDELIR